MSEINYQVLREAAESASKINWTGLEDDLNADGYMRTLTRYIQCHSPIITLSLLDERNALNERIAELEANLAAMTEDHQRAIESIKQADSAVKLAHEKFSALAAENAGLKSAHPQPFGAEMMKALDAYEKHQDEVPETGMLNAFFILRDSIRVDTPATDAFLAEIRAEARNEGVNYTASRLAAAFNHGFINKSLREVFDVTRMILSAKEELANEAHPIDGLSGEYAEKSLEEWAEQIRKGADK
ncbi:TPA: ead/Ea22-like family protein [Escherichia coli]|uniref:ead/Ea22-like family protein n=1 Tax=Escherichia coli TaxID=562 RepID=UPI001C282BFD|nr:ead/Ea22-like family protein [Escherichia coli]